MWFFAVRDSLVASDGRCSDCASCFIGRTTGTVIPIAASATTDLALPGLVPGGPAARMQLGDPCQQDSIAIGCRLCDRLRADIFSGAAPVLDHDLLSPHFGQPVR